MQLFKLPNFPNEIAVSKIDSYMDDGAFFLDFGRPLKVGRWLGVSRRLGVHNRWIGIAAGLLVPVVHQGQHKGGYVIGIERSDPQFANLRALWKKYYGWQKPPPDTVAGGIKIIVDFATQFPDDAAPPSE